MRDHVVVVCLLVLSPGAAAVCPRAAIAQWQPDGTPVCTAVHDQGRAAEVPDGAGGAIIVWEDGRNGSVADLYAQRLDQWGNALWVPDGVAVCTAPGDQSFPSIISDGAGGAIIAWTDGRDFATSNYDVYAQRLNASGETQWTADGVALCTLSGGQHYPVMAGNGAGGATVVWTDYRTGSTNPDLYATRLTSGGAVLDGPDGIAISARATGEGSPAILPYGGGGAIIAWVDARNGAGDIYAARLSSSGVLMDTSGIAICQAAGDQYYPACVGDDAGGAIIAWMDVRSEAVYAQRINASGAIQWALDGVPVGSPLGSSIFTTPGLVADGAGGAIVLWPRYSGASGTDLSAQRIDAAGAWQWLPAEVPVCNDPSDQRLLTVVPDDSDGAIAVWEDNRSGPYDLYAQRVGPSGAALWTMNGVVVPDTDTSQHEAAAAPDGTGGVIVAWKDNRGFLDSDIYAQRLWPDGHAIAGAGGGLPASLEIRGAQPNPSSGSTNLALRLEKTSDISVDLFDVAGRRVRGIVLRGLPAGWQRIALDGRDDSGDILPDGTYLCRVVSAGAAGTEKIEVLR